MMTKEEFTKIVNFITPWAEIVYLGCGHIDDIVKMLNFIRIVYYTHGHRAD